MSGENSKNKTNIDLSLLTEKVYELMLQDIKLNRARSSMEKMTVTKLRRR
jgi:hypothetical protein